MKLRNWYLAHSSAWGIVSGHDKLSDGLFIHTSKVMNVSAREDGTVEIQTRNNLYEAKLSEAVFDMFDDDFKNKIPGYNELVEKYSSVYDFPKEILENEGILIELSKDTEHNYVSCLANVEQKMYKELCPYVHSGMFTDSVLLKIHGLPEFDCRYFPTESGCIEFYNWRTPYKVMIKNLGNEEIEVKILDFKKTVAPSEVIEVPEFD